MKPKKGLVCHICQKPIPMGKEFCFISVYGKGFGLESDVCSRACALKMLGYMTMYLGGSV